jgi:eukaryotic-like serine/threonine-protein kinase
MAPELLMGEAASTASEMWALGVIAYEMRTGVHPFITHTATAWQKDVLIGRFTPVHVHRLNVSPDLQAFFEQVFQLDPSRRIGSAQVFQSELECALKVPDTAG